MPARDPGGQNERTALSWQRTALSLMAGSAALTRITFGTLGLFALTSMAIVLPLASWVFVESRNRYRHDAGVRDRGRARDGRAVAALAVATAALALVELVAALSS